jgi:hypothetical protein
MTEVEIFAGICGFTTNVVSEDKGGYKAVFHLESECPNWRKFNEAMGGKEINVMAELFKNRQTNAVNSQVIDLALKTIPHVSCPVISGVLKALEVSTGLALAKDTTISFK